MKKELDSEFVAFVKEYQDILKDDDIHPSADIEEDLYMWGEDGIEFLIAYGKRFNVDLTSFMADKYFAAESAIYLEKIVRLFGVKRKRKSLKLYHLQKGIHSGVLNENVINEIDSYNS